MFLRHAAKPLSVATAFACLRIRTYQTSSKLLNQQMLPRPTIDEDDLEESFLKGSGPGGQKINKTASAVQLKHIPSGLVIKSQATRSRSQNRKIARRILAEKLEVMEKGEGSRAMIKAEVKRKKKASTTKKSRRKYRILEEAKSNGVLDHSEEKGTHQGIGPLSELSAESPSSKATT